MSPTEDLFITIATPSAARGHIAELLLGKDSLLCTEGAPAIVFSLTVTKAGGKHIQGSYLLFLGYMVTLYNTDRMVKLYE